MAIPTRKESGFTLIEVLVAFTILAVGILGMNAMIMNASQSERYAGLSRTANRLAMKHLEELRSMGDNANDVAILHGTNVVDTGTGDRDETFGGFMILYGVSPTAQDNALLATVTVGWGCGSDCTAEDPCDPNDCKYHTAVSGIIFTRPN